MSNVDGSGATNVGDVGFFPSLASVGNTTATTSVQSFSERLIISDYDAPGSTATGSDIGMNGVQGILIELDQTIENLRDSLLDTSASTGVSFNYINWDVRSTGVAANQLHISLINSTGDLITGNKYCDANSAATSTCTSILLVENGTSSGYDLIGQGAAGVATSDGGNFNSAIFGNDATATDNLGIYLNFTRTVDLTANFDKNSMCFFSLVSQQWCAIMASCKPK